MINEVMLLDIEERIVAYLISLSIFPCLGGFDFLREAVKLVCLEPGKIKNFNNVLYKEVALIFNTEGEFIDGKIRHAIQSAHRRNGFEKFNERFNCKIKGECPTPKELIIALQSKLMKEVG